MTAARWRGAPFAGALLIAAACGRPTVRDAHVVNGEVFYTERERPSLADQIFFIPKECQRGTRDDSAAIALVPRTPTCTEQSLAVEYVVDGVHNIRGCGQVWRIECKKDQLSNAMSCETKCEVTDHYSEVLE